DPLRRGRRDSRRRQSAQDLGWYLLHVLSSHTAQRVGSGRDSYDPDRRSAVGRLMPEGTIPTPHFATPRAGADAQASGRDVHAHGSALILTALAYLPAVLCM